MNDVIKILIIDDSRDDWELYRRSLTKGAEVTYKIFEAGDGEEGLENLIKYNPDCILLDYSLPGRNGIEVLKRIRTKSPHVAVVIMTGQGNENVAVSAIKEGAQDYIAKSSITPDTLQRTVRVAIEYCAMQRRIRDQQTSLEIFSRALAHDLKEPVTTIRSFLDLLMTHETFSQRGQSHVQYVKNAADRMAALIDTVYFYTRLDGNPQEIAKSPCDMNEIFKDTKDNLASLIEGRKAIITGGEGMPTVFANRVQLTQVLQNLLANAIHYCETDPIINVQVVEEKDTWKISVADNGPGINAELRSKIFEPFKRLSRTKGKGLGLGLAICKKIIESHGGRIWHEFGAITGTTFHFSLPKQQVASQPHPMIKETADRVRAVMAEEDLLANILLVEDNEADIELTRLTLLEESKLRCNLLVAGDAFEALNMMQAEIEKTGHIDLLLLDINMPGMDGFELLERMQADEHLQNVPVLFCTTSNYNKDMDRAKSLGASGYMTKPAELSKLKSALGTIPTIRLQQDENGYVLVRAA